jgi:hypothetical protein
LKEGRVLCLLLRVQVEKGEVSLRDVIIVRGQDEAIPFVVTYHDCMLVRGACLETVRGFQFGRILFLVLNLLRFFQEVSIAVAGLDVFSDFHIVRSGHRHRNLRSPNARRLRTFFVT